MYQPPELLNKEEFDAVQLDLWALGIILYEMVIGKRPFAGYPYRNTDNKSEEEICFPRSGVIISLPAQNFINSMLKKKPDQRLTKEEIFNHRWIAGI